MQLEPLTGVSVFQSTHPARGATTLPGQLFQLHLVSIHAPREGCDCVADVQTDSTTSFNPRTPRGVRPVLLTQRILEVEVSIHAPREGCDRFYLPKEY